MVENIKKINVLLDENKEPKEILIFRKNGNAPTREAFQEEHIKLLIDFAKENGIDPTNSTQNEGDLDFIKVITYDDFEGTRKVEEEFKEELENVNVKSEGDSEADEEEEEKSDDKEKEDAEEEETVVPDENAKEDGVNKGKIAAGVIGGAVALGLLGVGLHSCSKQATENQEATKVVDFNDATFEELMNSLSETSERRIFCESVYNVTNDSNAKMVSTDVFALEEDGEAKLQFTYDEVMAAKLAFNNYSGEELKAIFGMEELNSQALQANYQSFVSKMSKFAMNGKALSPVSQLIENEQNREWLVSLETAIVDFNKEVENGDSELINEKADKVIRTFAYFYNHGINGVDGISNDAATLNCIKNLALNMISGYYDANVEEDYEQYLVVSSAPNEFDEQYITEELAQVQKGETLKFYKEEAEKGVCTLSVVFEHFDSIINTLTIEQDNQKDYEQLLIMNLAEVLLDEGETELSAKLLSDGMTEEVRKEIEALNDNCKNELKSYDETMNVLYENIPSFEQITVAAQKDNYNNVYKNIYGNKSEQEVFGAEYANLSIGEKLGALNEKINSFIPTLYNNRIRGIEKINVNSNSDNVITQEEWDAMTPSEKEEYAEEHGEVSIDREEHSEQVNKEDLTPEEQEEAERQEDEIEDSVIVDGEEYQADEATAAAYAIVDVKAYCDSVNISQTMLEDARDGSISYDTYINSSRIAMNNAMSDRGITNEAEKNAYKNAWNAYIKDRVDYAVEVKQEEDRVKEEALKEIEEANKQNSSNNEDNSYNDVYEEEDYVQETPSNDEDYWLDDPQLAPPVDGDDIPIVEEPVAPVFEDYDSYVAATLLALEEASQQEEVLNQKVKTI